MSLDNVAIASGNIFEADDLPEVKMADPLPGKKRDCVVCYRTAVLGVEPDCAESDSYEQYPDRKQQDCS